MRKVDDSLHVFVDNTIAGLAGGTRVSVANMTDHQMAVVREDGISLTTASVGTARDKCFIVQRHGTQLVWSPPIRRSGLVSHRGQTYSAPAQQVTHIGFAGAGASTIDAISDNTYIVRLIFNQPLSMVQDKQMLKFGIYKSDSSATREEILAGLVTNLISNFKRESDNIVRFEALCDNAGVNVTGATGSWTFTNNSKTVSYTGADISNATFVVGAYLRIGDAITAPIYRIDAINTVANIVTLGWEYQGATATVTDITAAGTPYDVITAALVAAAAVGIQCRAIARRFTVGSFKYFNTNFNVSLQDFGATQLVYTTAADDGSGYGASIMEAEWFAVGTEGFNERLGVPPPVVPHQIAVETNNYSVLSLGLRNQVGGTAINVPAPARNEILIAGQRTAGPTYGTAFYGGGTLGIVEVLAIYLDGAPGYTAFVPA
ncbi:MAG: hypothetical protein UV51_C0015G0003 [Candidatus Woesebacteria bacterium GW2011_GWC1_42_9]|nr:MAG: hypothetical protein UV51_C0015G0003 [Candidatus Woesebacteria bacterium GW2011_GWC1_42_9]